MTYPSEVPSGTPASRLRKLPVRAIGWAKKACVPSSLADSNHAFVWA